MTSFRRGLRNKTPLVLVAALAFLVLALLAIQGIFTSGVWRGSSARDRRVATTW